MAALQNQGDIVATEGEGIAHRVIQLLVELLYTQACEVG
jgi:hypothetical protein